MAACAGQAACAHSARIISIPEGATVTVDGKAVGVAPFLYDERSGPPGRTREIKASLAGYTPIVRKQSVRICPTPANLILDSFFVGFFVGFCLQDEYVLDFTAPAAGPAKLNQK